MLSLRALVAAVVLLCLAPGAIHAQCESGCWLPGSGIPGADDKVRALARLGDTILVGGDFTVAGDVIANHVARFDLNSHIWSALGAGFDNTVRTFAVTPSGQIIAGGDFLTSASAPLNHVATFDTPSNTWLPLASGVNGPVHAAAILPSGDLVVAGRFTAAGDVPAANIARYNVATQTWSPLGAGTDDLVYALLTLPSGELLVGGVFDHAGGQPTDQLARWNPESDSWTSVDFFIWGITTVRALTLLDSGDVVVGGDFIYDFRQGVARYSPSTGAFAALADGLISGPSTVSVRSLAMLPGNRVLVGGNFTFADVNTPSADLSLFDFNTNQWSAIGQAVEDLDFSTSGVKALLPLDGHSVIIAGEYYTLGDARVSQIAVRDLDTLDWSPMGVGTNRQVTALAALPDGRIVAGGDFTTLDGVSTLGIAGFDPVTEMWTSLDAPGLSGIQEVNAFAATSEGGLYAAGTFYFEDSDRYNELMRYDSLSHTWTPVQTRVALDQTLIHINAVAVLPDGDLLVAGAFPSIADVPARHIARYRPSTNTWSALPGDFSDGITSLNTLPGGDVVVAGRFRFTGPFSTLAVVRYRPDTNEWLRLGSPFLGGLGVDHVVVHNNTVTINGSFILPGHVERDYLARFNLTTNAWTPISVDASLLGPMAALSNGDIILTGRFASINGVAARNLARYSPSSAGAWYAIGAGLDQAAQAAVTYADRVYLGGPFTAANNTPAAYFTRVEFANLACPTDINHDAHVNSQDFFDFLVAFYSSGPAADFNGDQGVNSQDFFDFITAFFAGC